MMFSVHFSGLALILMGSGLVGYVAGGLLCLTFDVSDLLPPLGMLVVILSVVAFFLGAALQIGAWVYT